MHDLVACSLDRRCLFNRCARRRHLWKAAESSLRFHASAAASSAAPRAAPSSCALARQLANTVRSRPAAVRSRNALNSSALWCVWPNTSLCQAVRTGRSRTTPANSSAAPSRSRLSAASCCHDTNTAANRRAAVRSAVAASAALTCIKTATRKTCSTTLYAGVHMCALYTHHSIHR